MIGRKKKKKTVGNLKQKPTLGVGREKIQMLCRRWHAEETKAAMRRDARRNMDCTEESAEENRLHDKSFETNLRRYNSVSQKW